MPFLQYLGQAQNVSLFLGGCHVSEVAAVLERRQAIWRDGGWGVEARVRSAHFPEELSNLRLHDIERAGIAVDEQTLPILGEIHDDRVVAGTHGPSAGKPGSRSCDSRWVMSMWAGRRRAKMVR